MGKQDRDRKKRAETVTATDWLLTTLSGGHPVRAAGPG